MRISVSCPTGEEWRVSEHDQVSVTDDERVVEQMIEKLIVNCKRSWSWQWNVIEVAIFSTTLSAMCYLIYYPEWFFFLFFFFFLCHDLLTYFFLFFSSTLYNVWFSDICIESTNWHILCMRKVTEYNVTIV